jgi:nitrite reductase/ring-hydroxylating ferredoxin subunit
MSTSNRTQQAMRDDPAGDDSRNQAMTRRDWLSDLLLKVPAVVVAALSGAMALRFVLSSTSGPRTMIVRDPQWLPDRTLIPYAQAGVVVLRDGNRIAAISAICTHLGCTLTAVRDRGFECPCHGSRFDGLGQRLAGPATRDLPWYRINRLPDGRALVRLDDIVPAGTFSSLI